MVFQPVPLEQKTGTANSVFAPVPVDYDAGALNPVVAALIAAGFGTSGQVLATNSTGDGFEWVTP